MKTQQSKYRTMIGGQAIIEGIMMRGPEKAATVVRSADGIVVKEEIIKPLKQKYPVLGWPFLRGVIGFYESMKLGISSLTYSADFYPDDEDEKPSKLDDWIENKLGEEKAKKLIMGIALTLGIALPIALFILLPTLLAGTLDSLIGSGIWRNLLEGALRITIFLLFLLLSSRTKDIQRVFAYHGAEHKTIHCYEAGLPLTVENVRKFPRQHPRCGTSFLFVIMIVSIVVFAAVSWSNPFVRMALRLLLLPVVVGLSYEINRYVGKNDNPFTIALRAPGLWFQNITTREPDDSMIEVGIEALTRVIPEEAGADKW